MVSSEMICYRSSDFLQPVVYPMCIELMPDVVRDRILLELKTRARSHQTDKESRKIASLQYAMLQLKFVTLDMNAASVVDEALQFLGESAIEGNALAQQSLGPIFDAFDRQYPIDDNAWLWLLLRATWRRSLTAQKQLRRQSEMMYQSARILYRSHVTETGKCTLARSSLWDDINSGRVDLNDFLSQDPIVSCQNLAEATNAGRTSLVSGMLATGHDVNQIFEDGETALLRACRHGHLEVVKLLVDAGADPRIASLSNKTPLHFLPAFDDEEIPLVARLLLSRNANLEGCSLGGALDLFSDTATIGTPLQWAVDADNKPACEVLIAAGADAWFHRPHEVSAVARAAGRHQHYLLETLLSSRHVRPHLMRPISANVKTWCLEAQDSESDETRLGEYPVAHALSNTTQNAFGGTFGRLTLHGKDYQKAFTDTLALLLSHGCEPQFPGNTVLDMALQSSPPFVIEWVLNWYRSHDNPIPTNINNSVGTLVKRGDREMFDLLVREGVVPPQRSSVRQAAIIRMAGFSDDPHYLTQYVRAEQAENSQANGDLTVAFEQAVINGRYKVAMYLFEEGDVDLIPYKANNRYHDSANILGRFLQRSKRFMNIEKRVRFVAGLTDRAFIAAGKPFGGEILSFEGVAMSPLHAAVLHGEFRSHFKPDNRIVDAMFETLPNFAVNMPIHTPAWHVWVPFHLAVDVGNVPALNEFLGRENTDFDKLTGDGENAYDIAVSRFGSPSKSPEYWGVPDSMKERHIEERDLTTMQILDILYDDFGLKPKKKTVTIYRPKEDYVVIIPPRGGEIKTWVANIEDVIAIPEDTQDLILSKIRALSSGRSFFLTISDEIAHIFAEHIAYAIQEHVPQLDERVGQVRTEHRSIWPPGDELDRTFNLPNLFPARGSALEGRPHAIYHPSPPQSTLPW